jgi:hypothetical protein
MFRTVLKSLTIQQIYKRYVNGLYMTVLHGNVLRTSSEEQAAFMAESRRVLEEITDKDIISMHNCGAWREQLVASWVCGLGIFPQHREHIGELLLKSATCFAGQMHCFALARFADEESARYLVRYLERYLPLENREFDQGWAIGALVWLDAHLQCAEAGQFLHPRELWQVHSHGNIVGEWDPQEYIRQFDDLMEFVADHFPLEAETP